jgi:hypothetical protein
MSNVAVYKATTGDKCLLRCDTGQYGRRNRMLPYLETASLVPSETTAPITQHHSQGDSNSHQYISQPVYATCGMKEYARTVVQFSYLQTCGMSVKNISPKYIDC